MLTENSTSILCLSSPLQAASSYCKTASFEPRFDPDLQDSGSSSSGKSSNFAIIRHLQISKEALPVIAVTGLGTRGLVGFHSEDEIIDPQLPALVSMLGPDRLGLFLGATHCFETRAQRTIHHCEAFELWAFYYSSQEYGN